MLTYAAVIAATLIVTGLALYFSLREQLFEPVAERTLGRASFHAGPWSRGQAGICANAASGNRPAGSNAPPRLPTDDRLWIICFDATGRALFASTEPPSAPGPVEVPVHVRSSDLVVHALRDGSAWRIVGTSAELGPHLLGAVRVRNAEGDLLGVVQIAQPVEREFEILALVRNLFLGLGALMLGLACGGGWLMASRALAPARLAMSRQQAFISDASHEFRTPLTLMRANAELLLRHRDRFAPDDAEVLDDIVAETEHMSRLANDLLTLARLDAGRLELEREVVDLSDVAQTLIGRVKTLAHERRITLEEKLAGMNGEGDRPLVYADPQYTQEAGLILVENAVKYTPAGGTVTVCTQRRNGLVSLVIEDSGPGIPKEHLGRLGERFFRADASRNRATGGTGLGLAIAFRIAHAHGGNVHLDSEPNKGTRATLSMPAFAP